MLVAALADVIGEVASPWGYFLLFGLCVGESSAFIGLFVPGETALLLAGVLCHQGRLSLPVAMAVAVAGAAIGDSIGYEVGRHLGPRILRTRLGQRVGQERWERARAYLRQRGGRAVFLGRFVGVLRALVPAVAGDARLPYGRFLVWNVAGALVIAPGTILIGYLAGDAYQKVEGVLGPATLALAAALVVGVVVRHQVRKRRG